MAGRATAGLVPVFAEFLRERHPARGDQEHKEARHHGRAWTASRKADQVLRLRAERMSHSEIPAG